MFVWQAKRVILNPGSAQDSDPDAEPALPPPSRQPHRIGKIGTQNTNPESWPAQDSNPGAEPGLARATAAAAE